MDLAEALTFVTTACREAGLQLEPRTAWRNDEGWAYHTVEVEDVTGQAWIFRFPSRPSVAIALQRELTLLPWLSGRLPVPVPRPRIVGHSPPFMGYQRLGGQGLTGRQLADPAVAGAVADTLLAIHALSTDQAQAHGLNRYDRASWHDFHCGLMARARAAVPVPAQIEHQWTRELADPGLWPERMTVVHGDIGRPHLLASGDRLTGLIDWESSRIADPALDLAGVLVGWGEVVFAGVLERYRRGAAARGWPDDPRLADRVRFLARMAPLHTIGYGLETGQDDYVHVGAAALRDQLEGDGTAIGR